MTIIERGPHSSRVENLIALFAAAEEWQPYANCLGVDPDLFFPTRGESSNPAKAVCRECPVREECLEYALRVPEKYGVWGGTSEKERRRMRVDRARRYLGRAS